MSAIGRLKYVFVAGRLSIEAIVSVVIARTKRKELAVRKNGKRVTIVQFGDYAEAYQRFMAGGTETYYAQKYSVDFISTLAGKEEIERVSVICLKSDLGETALNCGVYTRGIELYPVDARPRYEELIAMVSGTHPTHLIVMTPCAQLIAWGVRAGIEVLPMFADSFRSTGLRARVNHWLLAQLLNARSIEVVANHNLAASLDLKRIGVWAGKILPFDWPAVISPANYAPKKAPASDSPFRVIYVGSVVESKGIGDTIRAVGKARARGRQVVLTVIGAGELDTFRELASKEHVDKFVEFLGVRPHSEVLASMREHDAVVVPSRWAYAEGLPMTLYEAMCTHTPLITSDHPMFRLRIRDGYGALVFPERNAEALADCIEKLMESPRLYEELSVTSAIGARDYLCPLKYDVLISLFLSPTRRKELFGYSLEHLT